MATMISEVYEALREIGVSEPQAKAAAVAISAEHIATKQDIQRLEIQLKEKASKSDIEALRVASKGDIEALRVASKSDIDALRVATKDDIDALRIATKEDIHRLEKQLIVIKWMLAVVIAVIVLPTLK
ncbi:MAG: hypothetical protein ACR2RB_04255, partial [Gammaproteobacteria bacterium]